MSKILHPSIYKDETGELFLELNSELGAIIHMYAYEWSVSAAKHYMHVWTTMLVKLKEKGFITLYAARLEDDDKLKRFAEHFGMKDTDKYIMDHKGNKRRLMSCDL